MLERPTIYSVSALNYYIKSLFNNDTCLKSPLCLKGEISTLRMASSGHYYFSISDENAKIKAVMFARAVSHLTFKPHEGDEVLVYGKVDLYLATGEYQIIVEEMEPSGYGQALIKLEKLKKKLSQEGLFDEAKKKKIPSFPHAIGLITADGSAAYEDLKKNIFRRYPIVKLYLFKVQVQGEKAPSMLVDAIKKAETYPLDTIIIGRGGGSNEDLSAFNDEMLVRAIAACPIPIISAVGHEIDYTLVDLASDLRVSTPTAAAEKSTPDIDNIYLQIDHLLSIMKKEIKQKINDAHHHLQTLKNSPALISPIYHLEKNQAQITLLNTKMMELLKQIINSYHYELSLKKQELERCFVNIINQYQKNVQNLEAKINALSPDDVLKRGYSYLKDENGHIISSISDVHVNQEITASLSDGQIISIVKEKEKNNEQGN